LANYPRTDKLAKILRGAANAPPAVRDAKNGFGRLIDTSRAEPAAIEKYGRTLVIVLAVEEYQRLTASTNSAKYAKARKARSGEGRLSKWVESAWLWLRHQPDSALSGWFRARVGNERGRIRRITIVALARKLLIALWRYVTQGEVPEGAVLTSAQR
jgi:hypothetical protein